MNYELLDRKGPLGHWKAAMWDLPVSGTASTMRRVMINVTRKVWWDPTERHAFYVESPLMVVMDDQELISWGKGLVEEEIDKRERDERVAEVLMED